MKSIIKKSIDSFDSQKVSGEKIKGGIVATGSHNSNNPQDSVTLTQGKLKGRLGEKGGSSSITITHQSKSL
jgi:hypothetical protein